MSMQDFKRCPVESTSPVHESSPQNTLGLLVLSIVLNHTKSYFNCIIKVQTTTVKVQSLLSVVGACI